MDMFKFEKVAALVEYPDLLNNTTTFPEDARTRARMLLDSCGGNIGAYSHSMGVPLVRKHVAEFIKRMYYGVALLGNQR